MKRGAGFAPIPPPARPRRGAILPAALCAATLAAAIPCGVPARAATPGKPPSGAQADVDGRLRARLDEPFAVRGQFPLTLPFLDVTPRSAFMMPAGAFRFTFGLAYESTHALSDDMLDVYAADDHATYEGKVTQPILEQTAATSSSGTAYYVDGETARLTAGVLWGISDRFELGVTLPLVAHTGGFMDSPIERYHEALGFPDGGRPPFARDQYVVGLSDNGHTVFLGGAPGGLAPGDLLVEARVALARPSHERFALTAIASFELPTGDPDRLDGNGSLDAGAGLAASWRLQRWSFHAGAQYAWLGSWDPDPWLAPRERLAGFFSTAFLASPRTSIVSNVLGGTGPFHRRSGGELGDTGIEIAVGVRHAATRGGDFEVALLENILPDMNVPDVGLYLGWAWRTD